MNQLTRVNGVDAGAMSGSSCAPSDFGSTMANAQQAMRTSLGMGANGGAMGLGGWGAGMNGAVNPNVWGPGAGMGAGGGMPTTGWGQPWASNLGQMAALGAPAGAGACARTGASSCGCYGNLSSWAPTTAGGSPLSMFDFRPLSGQATGSFGPTMMTPGGGLMMTPMYNPALVGSGGGYGMGSPMGMGSPAGMGAPMGMGSPTGMGGTPQLGGGMLSRWRPDAFTMGMGPMGGMGGMGGMGHAGMGHGVGHSNGMGQAMGMGRGVGGPGHAGMAHGGMLGHDGHGYYSLDGVGMVHAKDQLRAGAHLSDPRFFDRMASGQFGAFRGVGLSADANGNVNGQVYISGHPAAFHQLYDEGRAKGLSGDRLNQFIANELTNVNDIDDIDEKYYRFWEARGVPRPTRDHDLHNTGSVAGILAPGQTMRLTGAHQFDTRTDPRYNFTSVSRDQNGTFIDLYRLSNNNDSGNGHHEDVVAAMRIYLSPSEVQQLANGAKPIDIANRRFIVDDNNADYRISPTAIARLAAMGMPIY